MFINISNHPARSGAGWQTDQWQAAIDLSRAVGGNGIVFDIPFPDVGPHWTTQEVVQCAQKIVRQVYNLANDTGTDMDNIVVHVMGEAGLTYRLVRMLSKQVRAVVHSTTARTIDETGRRIFSFCQFREY